MDFIEILKYIFLGIIQGFTEPLPISSSGHMVIFSEMFNIGTEDINLEIIANAGSLVAILIIYSKDILYLVKNFVQFLLKKEGYSKKDFNYVLLLIVAVIPAGVAGLLLKDVIETYLTTLTFVGIGLFITALALLFIRKEAIDNTNDTITMKEALMIGLFQIFALMPGISRSGSTMVGGLKSKISFKETMRFSFLLYIPISLASMVLGLSDINVETTFVLGYVLAFLFAIITTYFAVKLLFRLVQKGNLIYFSIYCFVVGIIVIIYDLV
jgi:undecaprenyl-diphosphatase